MVLPVGTAVVGVAFLIYSAGAQHMDVLTSTKFVCREWQRKARAKNLDIKRTFVKSLFLMHAVACPCCFPWKNCKNVKCSTITCKLEDVMLKGEYFVNVSTRIWNGTFAAVSISCIFMKNPILKYFLTPDIFQSSVKRPSNLERPSFILHYCVCFSRLKTWIYSKVCCEAA